MRVNQQGFKMAEGKRVPPKVEKIVHRIEPTEVGQLLRDPAIEKWARMKETTTDHFRISPYTLRLGLFWFAAVPFGVFMFCKYAQWAKDEREGRPKSKLFPDTVVDSD